MSKPQSPAVRAERIRILNDTFRQSGGGGRIMITAGVQERGQAFISRAMDAIARFDAFDEGNDPYHEHDFGALMVEGEKLFFKIDAYDPTLTAGSPDPTDPALTVRVMTVMLASEY
ncbi:MAG: DUF3768 domain-containing protein [Hyphomonas sp.]|nr:DUF3768 domain-containing protein [Hyphomonas sp.]